MHAYLVLLPAAVWGFPPDKNLLAEVRKMAIRDELLEMRLRGRLVVPLVVKAANRPTSKG